MFWAGENYGDLSLVIGDFVNWVIVKLGRLIGNCSIAQLLNYPMAKSQIANHEIINYQIAQLSNYPIP